MNIGDIFFAYAQAFEKTYKDDNWSRLKSFFAADAVYLTGDGNEIRGRDGIFEYLRNDLNAFDRRFEIRRAELISRPVVTNETVTIRWKASYQMADVPEVVLSGSEVATFEKNVISKLEDTPDDGVAETLQEWLAEHGGRLSD